MVQDPLELSFISHLSLDRDIDIVAFFDDSKEFKGTKINQVDILVDFDELEKRIKKI